MPPEEIRRVLYMLDLARAHIEIGDTILATKSLTGCLFAVAYLTEKKPWEVATKLVETCPSDEDWEETIVPDLLRQD